jgi:uncharacterized protein (DUF1499 family)
MHEAMRIGALLAVGLAIGCGGSPPDTLGVGESRLSPCPSTSNCVCSDDSDSEHGIEPFRLAMEADAAWDALQDVLSSSTRTRIVTRTADYIHAEATSLVFRFVDDVEFHLRSEDSSIAVRSASRLGTYDFGVNGRRIERLRDRLTEAGALRRRER